MSLRSRLRRGAGTALRRLVTELLPQPLWSLAFFAVLAAPAAAQDFRGTVLGTVTDATGAVLPGVAVVISNVETGISTNVVTDDKGQYQVRALNSGTYEVKAELTGFRPFLRQGLQVKVGEVLLVNVEMEVGIGETTIVTAEEPVLNVSAVTGRIIDSEQIRELPLADGTAYMLTRLAPGIMDASDLHFSRPMDNGNLAGVVSNGVIGGNDFTLDGAPNRVSPNNGAPGNNAGVIGFSPTSEAISEFNVQTNAFDAQAGQTAGAVVNLALKTGGNAVHGTLSYFNRDDSRAETPLLVERANGTKPTRDYNRMAGTLNGPIVKNRTFFLVSYEHLKDVQPEPATYTVPTDRMRRGDFSEFTGVTIYDPLTSTGGNNQRTAFPGNQIPADRISPIARQYLSYYPAPNQAGTANGTQNNYFTSQSRPYDYDAVLGRIDHNFAGGHKLFLTAFWNKRREDRYDWAGVVNGFAVTKGYDYRSNTGGILGYTAPLTPSLLLDVRVGLSEFGEYRDPAESFDPANLGFSSTALGVMGGYQYMPLFTFGAFAAGANSGSTIASLGAQRSDFSEGFDRPFRNASFAPTVTKIAGRHTFRFGYDLRFRQWDITNAGYQGGRFHFNGAYTRLNNAAPTNDRAQSFAQFLLGLPTVQTAAVATPGGVSSQFEIAAPGDFRQLSHGVFLQDDWRINPKLTVNLGVRLEIEQGLTEAENRNLAGFDTVSANPIEAAARSAYARSPIPEIAAADFRVPGGVVFADGAAYNTQTKPLPRAAFSYLLDDKTVVRGGLGLFSYPYYFDAVNQVGFSQPTGIVVTENNGGTFVTDLANPLPSGQLSQPVGSSQGLATQLGLNLGTIVPAERKSPYYTRWQAGIQRDLGAGWRAELIYVGSIGRNLPVVRAVNGVPTQYLSTSPSRDTTRETYLSAPVTNPFQGLLPGSGNNGSTVQRQQLLRPFPEFGNLATEEYEGSDRYHAGTVILEKRFSNGNSLMATYTRSRLRDKLNYLNPADPVLEDRVSPNDRPNRITAGASLKLPFGRGRHWGKDANGLVEAILGGWQVTASYQYQTGFPLAWGASVYYDPSRNPNDLVSNIGETVNGQIAGLDVPGWDVSGFYFPDPAAPAGAVSAAQRNDSRIQLGNNVRYFPSTLDNVRTHDLHLLDAGLYKNFSLPRDMKLQIRAEAVNALNYAVLWAPDQNPRNATFGYTTTDRNNPRDIQLGARLTF